MDNVKIQITETPDIVTVKTYENSANLTNEALGQIINAATIDTVVENTDYFPIVLDTTSILKRFSWAYIKSTLKTYFDTLYGASESVTGTQIADLIDAATADTAIEDTDYFPIVLNGTSILKKFSWANIKAALSSSAVLINTTPYVPTGTTQTIDLSLGLTHTLSLASASGTVTITLTNPTVGQIYNILVLQGANNRGLAYPATFKWNGGTALIPTTTNGKYDIITAIWNGTSYFASYTTNY